MATLTPTAFRLRYPSFVEASYSNATVQLALEDIALEMNETQWGNLYERGAYALTAHLLTITATGVGPVAGVVSRSVGDVSVTFAAGSSAMDDLGSTRYGGEYVRLRQLISGGPVVV